MKKKFKNPVITDENMKKVVSPNPNRIQVTLENAPKLSVHFLERIYARLGYIIKLMEEGKTK